MIHHFASTRDAEIAANVSLAPFLPRVTALYVAGFEPCAAAYAALPNLAVIYASEYELGYVSVPEPFLPLVEYFVDEHFLDTVGAYSPDGPWKWIKKDCLACRAREEGEG